MTKLSSWSVSICSLAASIPIAIGKSKLGPSFFYVGGCEIDRGLAHWKFEAGIGQRGGNTVARFFHGGIREADDDDQGFPVAAVHFNLNGVGVNAVQSGGADTGEHWGFLRQPALNATGIFKTQSSWEIG